MSPKIRIVCTGNKLHLPRVQWKHVQSTLLTFEQWFYLLIVALVKN